MVVSAALGFFRFHVLRLNRYTGSFMFAVLAAEILTFIFIIYYIQSEIKKIVKMKTAYFQVEEHACANVTAVYI